MCNNDKYELVFQKYGPVLRYISNPQIQQQTIDKSTIAETVDDNDDDDDDSESDGDDSDGDNCNGDNKVVENTKTKPNKTHIQCKIPPTKRTKYSYKSIKPSLKLDLEKLKMGEYKIDELIEINTDN